MTKINKISKDLYKFIDEDNGTAVMYNAEYAARKQEEINRSVVKHNKSDEHIKQKFWELKHYIENNNTDEFKRYLKSVKSCSEVQVPTGRMIYNDDKYNAKYKSIMDQKAQLIIRFNDIANDTSINIADKTKAIAPIRKEINELNKIILSKDAKEFQDTEYITVKIKPIEAFETCLNMIERYNAECVELKQQAIHDAIKRDADSLKNIDDDDFVFIKRLYKLIDPRAFYDMFQYNHYDELKDAMLYESKEAYLNRPRDIECKSPELSFTNEELQSVIYLNNLKHKFDSLQSEKRLQDEAQSLMESLS